MVRYDHSYGVLYLSYLDASHLRHHYCSIAGNHAAVAAAAALLAVVVAAVVVAVAAAVVLDSIVYFDFGPSSTESTGRTRSNWARYVELHLSHLNQLAMGRTCYCSHRSLDAHSCPHTTVA